MRTRRRDCSTSTRSAITRKTSPGSRSPSLETCCIHAWRARCDVVVMLRLQNERMKGPLLPSAQEFFKSYGLTPQKLALAKPDAIVMHPGPMNRGVEIDSSVADGPHSVILPQVTFGIAVRMAVMSILAGN